MITFDKAHIVICNFISKYSTEELIEVLEFLIDSSDYYALIRGVVAREFGISVARINKAGNNQAIYRGACYYLHEKYDPYYTITKMRTLYGKDYNSIRNGLLNVKNIIESPRIDKNVHSRIMKSELKLKEILEWGNRKDS